jgi:hypothetical protein
VNCACGVPSEANWYAEIVYGVTLVDDRKATGDHHAILTETDYEYGYFCEDHKPKPSDLKPEGRKHWKILESKVRRLR